MQNPDMNGSEPTTSDDRPKNARVTPVDLMLARFEKWLDDLETKLDQADKRADIPRDIPRFYTRYR